MRTTVIHASCFATGVAALEWSGTVLHAFILRDIPPELGLTPPTLFTRDAVLALLAGLVFAVVTLVSGGSRTRRPLQVAALGFGFALALELLYYVLPNALFEPQRALDAVRAWGFFFGGCALAAWWARRPGAST